MYICTNCNHIHLVKPPYNYELAPSINENRIFSRWEKKPPKCSQCGSTNIKNTRKKIRLKNLSISEKDNTHATITYYKTLTDEDRKLFLESMPIPKILCDYTTEENEKGTVFTTIDTLIDYEKESFVVAEIRKINNKWLLCNHERMMEIEKRKEKLIQAFFDFKIQSVDKINQDEITKSIDIDMYVS